MYFILRMREKSHIIVLYMIHAINPLDGRYGERVRALVPYFSESALMKYRVMMECEYLIALSNLGKIGLKKLNASEVKIVRDLYNKFNDASYLKIKDFEATTNHDVKAVEYFIKEKLAKTSLKNSIEWVHFATTSEDTNNIAYALMLSDSLQKVLIPKIEEVVSGLDALSKKYKDLPMLARTH